MGCIGLALLMDVHRPPKANGYGVVLIPGSGFHALQGYDAVPLKNGKSAAFSYLPRLLDAGFTVFIVNHRAAPRFRYPAAVEDVQRAVRFIRHNAAQYSISRERIGTLGYSSGGYLASMLGVLDGVGDATSPDAVERESARVQAVVANAANADLTLDIQNNAVVVSFMGQVPSIAGGALQDPVAMRAFQQASPVTHVSKTVAPLLLIHGDADPVVSFRHAVIMNEAMQKSGAVVKFVPVPKGDHGFALQVQQHPEWPEVFAEAVSWLNQHLIH